MTHVVRDPVMVFRLALREGDLPLAGSLARALRGKVMRRRLERELERFAPGEHVISLGALRVLAHLMRALGLRGAQG